MLTVLPRVKVSQEILTSQYSLMADDTIVVVLLGLQLFLLVLYFEFWECKQNSSPMEDNTYQCSYAGCSCWLLCKS